MTEPDQELAPKLADKGYGAKAPLTIADVLNDTVQKHGDGKAMAVKRSATVSNEIFKIFSNFIKIMFQITFIYIA